VGDGQTDSSMRTLLGPLLLFGVVWGQMYPDPHTKCTETSQTVYGYTLRHVSDTRDIHLSDFRGKVLMVLNTASF